MSGAASLRLRLTLAIALVLGLALAAFSVVLHATVERAVWQQFDQRLTEDALAIGNMVEERAGPWEFEAGQPGDLERWGGPTFFEVWMDDGAVLARSASLGAGHLSSSAPGFADARLPDGRAGRVYEVSLLPRRDEEGPRVPSGRRVRVVVARPVDEVAASMAQLRLLLLLSGAAALALAALAGALAIRSGLRPLDRLAARLERIDAQRLGERLSLDDLPPELRLPVRTLNELLARLEGAFARERQFSADASHELRTPLAGLQATLEVAAARERTGAEYRVALAEALGIVGQLTALVESLLLLARLDARQIPVSREPVPLRALIDECFKPLEAKARARRLAFDNQVPAELVITSDRKKLAMVASNLLANAVEYTAEEGSVRVRADPAAQTLLQVEDSGPAIPAGALERIFERFVRLDAARAGGDHAGIGLALVRAVCGVLGYSVRAENTAAGGVRFAVFTPGERSPAAVAPDAAGAPRTAARLPGND